MSYLILANFYMAVFYTFYILLLKNETFFQYNRMYLTGTLLLSFLLPLIQLPWIRQWFSESTVLQVRASFDEVLVVTSGSPAVSNAGEAWSPLLVIYWAGVTIMALWLCFRVYDMIRQLRQPQAKQSFSFLHLVRVDQAQPGAAVIWQHERAHVRYLHSLDVLLAEVVILFSWFNPIAYLYRKSIKLQHEYQADAFVAANGKDAAGYAEILLSNAFHVPLHTLTNHFNQQSFIKNRIVMLFKEKSKRTALLKYAFAAPLFAAMVIFSSAKSPEISLADTLSGQGTADEPVQQRGAIVQQGEAKFLQGLGGNIRYAEAALNAKKAGVIGLAFVKTGVTITDIQTMGDFGYGMEAEVIRALKTPAVNETLADGKYFMNIRLGLGDAKQGPEKRAPRMDVVPNQFMDYTKLQSIIIIGYGKKKSSVPVANSQDTVKEKAEEYSKVEVKPEPQGGMAAFLKFVGDNYKYPQAAIDNGVNGRLTLEFVVNTDGSLSDIRVLKDLGFETGEEAIRVLKLSENWKPGLIKGKPVRVMYTLPIAMKVSPPAKEEKEQPE